MDETWQDNMLIFLDPVFPNFFDSVNTYIFVIIISEGLAIIVGTIVLKRLLRDEDITWFGAAVTVGITAFVSFIVSLLMWLLGLFL